MDPDPRTRSAPAERWRHGEFTPHPGLSLLQLRRCARPAHARNPAHRQGSAVAVSRCRRSAGPHWRHSSRSSPGGQLCHQGGDRAPRERRGHPRLRRCPCTGCHPGTGARHRAEGLGRPQPRPDRRHPDGLAAAADGQLLSSLAGAGPTGADAEHGRSG